MTNKNKETLEQMGKRIKRRAERKEALKDFFNFTKKLVEIIAVYVIMFVGVVTSARWLAETFDGGNFVVWALLELAAVIVGAMIITRGIRKLIWQKVITKNYLAIQPLELFVSADGFMAIEGTWKRNKLYFPYILRVKKGLKTAYLTNPITKHVQRVRVDVYLDGFSIGVFKSFQEDLPKYDHLLNGSHGTAEWTNNEHQKGL